MKELRSTVNLRLEASRGKALIALMGAIAISFFAGCTKLSKLGFSAGDSQNSGVFGGITAIQLSSEGKYILVWNPAASSGDFSTTTYEIFMDRWDSSKPLPTTAGLSNEKGSLPGSTLVDLDGVASPAANGALIASVKGVRSYTLSESLEKGIDYMFQVRSVNSDGQRDGNSRVLFYNLDSSFNFQGLVDENVTLSSDKSKINIRWNAATGARSTVKYVIYSDANFSQVLATTTQLTYEFMNPTKGQTYVFSVRAYDGKIPDNNSNFVAISIPDPSDKIPPIFSGLTSAVVASDKKIYLKWDASPSTDLAQYNVYFAHNLASAIASTSATAFLVAGLTPGATYSFVVRARDASGNEDANLIQKTETTLNYSVPDFSGLQLVSPVSGTAGLSSLRLSWSKGSSGTTGYQVFRSITSGSFDFNSPYADINNANTTTYTATGLNANTTYYFVVRAYDASVSPTVSEQNTVEKSNTTLQIKAPTFAGLTTAYPGAGTLALSTAVLTWPTPSSDGVYDGFVVQYQAGTCAQGFLGTPSETTVAGDSARTGTVTGLTAQTTYRFRVRARYSASDLRDTNITCLEVYTSPAAPVFSGISGLTRASGASGFTTATASWTAATGSFSYYKVEWATNANFTGATTITPNITMIATTSKTITGLPAKALIYVRVTAVYDESGITLSSGATTSISVTTTPTAPTGEGPSTVQILAADALKVNWTAPTNIASSLYNGYKLWKFCGASAPTNLIAKLSGPADHTYGTGVLSTTFTGLTSNTECCYQVRAYYDDGVNTLASDSSGTYRCQTPTLSPPTFAGVSSVSNPNTSSGFTSLVVNWPTVDVAEAGLFSYYEIDWSTTPSGQDWAGTIQVASRSTTSTTITSLTENTTYYVRVRAVNNNGSPSVSSGSDTVASATTTPQTPTGDNLSAATAISATKVQLTYSPPSSTVATGGLFNNVLLFVQAGTSSDVASYRTSIEAGGITAAEIRGQTSAKKITLTSVPAVIQIPYPSSELTADIANNIEIWGLTANTQICVQAVAAYWVNGQPTRYLPSGTPTTRCTTPTAVPPIFAGVSSISGFSDTRDFTQLVANFSPPTGECTTIEVSVQTTPANPNWTTPTATGSCSATSIAVAGLTPHTTYYVQVRAVNEVSGTKYAAGSGTELSRVTKTPTPAGDGILTAAITQVYKLADNATVTWTNPTSGYWNKTYLWRATGSSLSAAQAAVRAAAETNSGKTGSNADALAIYTSASATTTITDTGLNAGVYVCYLVKGVYADGTYYNASANDAVACDIGAYTTPTFAGVASGAIIGTWSDGTAKIELTFNTTPAGSIEEYWIYYSPTGTLASFGNLTAEPWQKISLGNSSYDATPTDNKILIGGNGNMVAGNGYYIVRYKFYYGPDTDTNTAISTVINVPENQANLAYVSPARSGLSYGYYMMKYEASVDSGSFGSDTVTSAENDLATCNYQFHVNGNKSHSSCGTTTSNRTVRSVKSVSPTSSTFAQSWWSCRRSGNSGTMMRLPTHEEWARAAKWVGTSFSTMWTTYATDSGNNCNTTGGITPQVTGARSSCKNDLNLYDVAGNAAEWVDSRMVRYNIDDPIGDGTVGVFDNDSERRFGYGPTIGRTIANGIDNVTRRFHMIDPGAGGLALLLGADSYNSSPADANQIGTDTQTWITPTATTNNVGFRCMAMFAATMPTMDQLALPQEPTYTTADYAGTANTWTIPENLYAKDTRVETIKHRMPPLQFPFTGGELWNFNNTSSSPSSIPGVFGEAPLSVATNATLTSGAGLLDGTSYVNTITSAGVAFSSSSTTFNTPNFTMGGWFYMSNWATGSYRTLLSKRDSIGSGIDVNPAGNIRLVTGGVATTLSLSALTPGWHHVAASLITGGLAKLYVDGVFQTSYACSTNCTNSTLPLTVGGDGPISGGVNVRIGPVFFHPGTAYTDTQIETVYRNQILNGYYQVGSYWPQAFYKGVNISWRPWSKTVCNPTCTTSTANMNYKIYRFIEPTRLSERTTTPWALTGGTNPYSSDKPLDPLAVDSAGSRIFTSATTDGKLVATISNCDTSTLSNCTIEENTSTGTGFSANKIYNYIMVAQDAASNEQPAMSQRFRTQYLAGPAPDVVGGAASFRLEPRYRRVAQFLLDEAYQQTQTRPQIMSYVPMDLSGLDHDFFIQKYEASSFSGAVVNNSPSGAGGSFEWPFQADTSGVWKSDAAKCYDQFNQNQAFSNICGNGSQVNTTTTVVQSKQGTAPLVSIDQGAFWKACRNTGIADDDGNTYYMSLPSDPEWMKAADWGDLNHDGTIDIGPNATLSAAALENGAADGTTVRCHTDNNPASAYNSNSSQTANCRTRYGTADMVGNVWEWTTGQIYNANGYDNGLDGSWYARTLPSASTTMSAIGGKYDLYRGYPVASGGATVADNADYYWYGTLLRGALRSGNSGETQAGRWALYIGASPSSANGHQGGRCRR